ncbi:MAG: GNAT family N-acetyltransferase [Candidatus Auribacterota bacterium]|nr:GNAT family N-acetyltransferase [Candidatus Auribacterota bacterium]
MREQSGIEYRGWDSNFFQKKIGRIRATNTVDIAEIVDQAGRSGYDCLFFETTFDQQEIVRYCLSHSFILTDIKTILSTAIKPGERISYSPEITLDGNREMRRRMEEIAANELAPLSRYSFDPGFGPKEAKRLYREWARQAAADTFSEAVILSIPAPNSLAGFITLRIRAAKLFIDLFAVTPEFRGKDIGSGLIRAASIWARKNSYKYLYVTTQGHNIPALRAYEKNGFKTDSMNLFLHRWL